MAHRLFRRGFVPCLLVSHAFALGCSSDDNDDGGPPPVFSVPPPATTPGTTTTPGATQTPAAPGGDTTPATDLAGSMTPGAPQGDNASGAPTTTDGAAGAPATPPDTETPAPTTGAASPGCGSAAGIPSAVNVPNTIVTFPPSYDGSTPVPLVLWFHGAGRTNEEMRTIDSRTVGSALEDNYVNAFVKSTGNAWDIGADYARFNAVLDQMLNELCIDTEHLFAVGHSSGAQFIAQMLGNASARETRLAGVVPVASSRFNNPAWEPVPTLVIHGLNDTSRPGDANGAQDIVQYTEANRCAAGTAPLAVPTCNSIAPGNVAVNPGCVSYQGCAAPTLFCNHDDPNYIDNGNPTNHGWPCFANPQIFEFFESLR